MVKWLKGKIDEKVKEAGSGKREVGRWKKWDGVACHWSAVIGHWGGGSRSCSCLRLGACGLGLVSA